MDLDSLSRTARWPWLESPRIEESLVHESCCLAKANVALIFSSVP